MSSSKKIKKPLKWSVKAINDRLEIWNYIAVKEHSPMNAVLVETRLVQAAERLSLMPEAGKSYKKGLRVLFVSKTSYAIVYRNSEESVSILRVSHQRRKNI
jgi:plasmid stabilization system protein ParE